LRQLGEIHRSKKLEVFKRNARLESFVSKPQGSL
jgi:hypothetical protein